MAVAHGQMQDYGLREEQARFGRDVWRRFRRNRLALVGASVLLVLAMAAVFAPWIWPVDPNEPDLLVQEAPPGTEGHPLGTDQLGRDVLARLLWGGRVSLSVGIVAVGISLSIGVIIGATAGYFGGWIDNVLMRLTDVVISFPLLVLLIVVASIAPPSIYWTMAVIGFVTWTPTARLVRGEFLSLREREFIEASRALGVGHARTVIRHMLPNAMAPVIVAATLGVAITILLEASLSFLGLGVQQPTPSWGNMLQDAFKWRVLVFEWWLWIPPGIMIFLAILSINLVGDGLRDALDPRLKN